MDDRLSNFHFLHQQFVNFFKKFKMYCMHAIGKSIDWLIVQWSYIALNERLGNVEKIPHIQDNPISLCNYTFIPHSRFDINLPYITRPAWCNCCSESSHSSYIEEDPSSQAEAELLRTAKTLPHKFVIIIKKNSICRPLDIKFGKRKFNVDHL